MKIDIMLLTETNCTNRSYFKILDYSTYHRVYYDCIANDFSLKRNNKKLAYKNCLKELAVIEITNVRDGEHYDENSCGSVPQHRSTPGGTKISLISLL